MNFLGTETVKWTTAMFSRRLLKERQHLQRQPMQIHHNNSETLYKKFAEEFLTGSKSVWSPSKKY